MFEGIRQSLRDAVNRASSPAEGREVVSQMRAALIEAKAAVSAMREGVELSRRQLAVEREQLETATRRGRLAQQIGDKETAEVAERFAARHGERVEILERKLAAQESEVALAEREVEEMATQFKRASLTGGMASPQPAVTDEELMGGPSPEQVRREVDRASRETTAEQQLAELKRRMGK